MFTDLQRDTSKLRATTACDPQIPCAAAAAMKIDENGIDLAHRSGVARLSYRSTVSVAIRVCSAGATQSVGCARVRVP
ncbi:unnamed protein product [Pieris brassicae]|uniref:Uncharacterized protein n=1 Tax=Pieris brassicae TaxID=7116 RepID=A0A9P0T852_PIEBR|nr:unnamed protein product [Pieris brassicae]